MLRIHLFGQLHVFDDDTLVRLRAPPKVVPLWAYLLLHRGVPVARDTLAAILWPDETEAHARANLRRHLYHLQRALPPAPPDRPRLLSDAETIRWNPTVDSWLDVAEFERLSQADDCLADAVALYAGDLLEHVYDDWLFYERERLRAMYHASLDRLILRCRSERAYPQAISYTQQFLASDPLREDVVRQLIALRYEAGDRAGALQEYERFARLLRAELAVEPMPETVALYEAVARNARLPGGILAPAAPPEAGRSAEQMTLAFVGREAELAELRVWWSRAARGRGGLALVGGEAGIGKTRLAEELARLVEAQGGRVLRGATMFTEPVPYQAIVDALRSALPLVAGLEIRPIWLAAVAPLLVDLKARRPDLPALAPLDPGRERARLFEGLARCFEELAHPRPLLLILEDLHWAGAATAACIEFLARRAGDHALLILGTYREEETPRAHPFRELLRRMRAERLVNHLALSRLPPSAVAALVEQTPGLDTSMGELAQRLYVESEGHPLFLNALISEQLEMGAAGNNGRARAVGSDHAPLFGRVRALITDHLARLSPSAQALAEVAAAVGPAFDIDLVGEIGGWGEGAALHGLDELLDQHLVHEVGGPSRYEYAFAHHLIQETIYAGIPDGTLQRRHRRIGRVIEQLYPTRLDDLAGALALHFDRGCEPERAAAYYLRAARRALAVYADQEAQAAASRGLELAVEPRTQVSLLVLREEVERREGQRQAQQADLERMEALARGLADDELICEALRRQILFRRRLGERETEAQLIAALKAQAVASGSQRWQAEALEAEAAYLVLLSRYDRARATLAQALELRRVLDDRNGQVACYCMLAEVAIHQGRISEARELLDRANSFPESLADRALVAQTVSTAAGAAIAHQDFGTSYALGQQMLELCAAIGDREGEADAHARIATAATRLFRIQEALDHYDKAREIYTALGKRQGEAAVLLNAGGLAARLGRYAEALDAFNQAEALFGELSDLRGQAASALNSAYTALLTSDYQAGKAAALRGLKLARMMEHRAFEATALANLGAAERELGELPRAVAHMQAGLAIRRELGQPANLASDLCDLTIAYLRAGDLALARQASDEMLAIHAAEQISDPQRVLWAAAQTYRALSDAPRAQELLAQAHAALQQQADAVPDPESRATFMELPFNSEILAAYGSDMWPGNAPC